MGYLYDADGRRTQMTVSGQASPVTYAYDNDNRLTTVAQGSSNVSFSYDAVGRRTALTLPNGIVVNYGYDQASELTGLTYSLAGNVLGNLTYAYDADGRRVQMGGSWARTGMPNPTTSTAVHNAANELTNWNGVTLTYDGNGNLLSDSANTYGWNARNQLDSISGTTAASFQYGPFGRRLGKTINGNTTNFLYDGVNPVQELVGGSPSANLLTGLGVDEYFQRTDLLGTSDFLDDALGSTLALADPTGTAQTEYTYDPFGGTTTQGAANASSFQFTGRENDGDGLYFYRARYYSRMVGRFISPDPIGFRGGIGLYTYADNDPVSLVDPSGNFSSEWHIAITYAAAIKAGYSQSQALALALRDAETDFLPGSQGIDPLDANMHAMAGRKQKCEGAYQGTRQQLFNDFSNNNLGRALHTIQDAFDPAHMFKPWRGELYMTNAHVIQDAYPNASALSQATDASLRLLQDWRRGTLKDPSSYLPSDPCH